MGETKTHVIDGVTYVEVDRMAEVGDRIYSDWSGTIYTVEAVNDTLAIVTKPGQLGHINGFYHGDYVVLEEPTTSIHDLLANLARRVTSLEQQLRDTQRNLETFAEQTESNSEDIHMLDERTQPKHADVFTFENFLDSVADKVAERLVRG